MRELVSAYAHRPLRLVSRRDDQVKVTRTALRDHPNRQYGSTSSS